MMPQANGQLIEIRSLPSEEWEDETAVQVELVPQMHFARQTEIHRKAVRFALPLLLFLSLTAVFTAVGVWILILW